MSNNTSVVIWTEAGSTTSDGPDPMIAAWKATEKCLLRIREMQALVRDNKLESCKAWMFVHQWGGGSEDFDDFEDEHKPGPASVVVDENSFYFISTLKYVDDSDIKTSSISIDELEAALKSGEPISYLGGDSRESVIASVEDCGGPVLRGD